jgi:proteasome lid subunit RPN8/RPN11
MLLVDEMMSLAEASKPNEACGLVVAFENGKKHRLVHARNIDESPRTQFTLDPDAWLQVRDEEVVIAIWHSHVFGNAEPSLTDRSACEASGLPWHIVSLSGDYRYIEPNGFQAPYEKRPYVYLVHDCYTLTRDWYKREWGLELPEFDRPNYWWERGQNLYAENFASCGFVAMPPETPIERGDAFLIQANSKVPNHSVIQLGGGKILHHVQGRLSSIDVWGGYWALHSTHHLRHISKVGRSDG